MLTRARQPHADILRVERFGISRGIVDEVMQLVPVGARHKGCQLDHRLVVFPRYQESNEVVAERLALFPAREEGIKCSAELINRLGGRSHLFARSGHRNTSNPKQNTR